MPQCDETQPVEAEQGDQHEQLSAAAMRPAPWSHDEPAALMNGELPTALQQPITLRSQQPTANQQPMQDLYQQNLTTKLTTSQQLAAASLPHHLQSIPAAADRWQHYP